MIRYHVNLSGDVGVCRAQSGNCPFGGEEYHYDTADQARAAYETLMHGPIRKKSSDEAVFLISRTLSDIVSYVRDISSARAMADFALSNYVKYIDHSSSSETNKIQSMLNALDTIVHRQIPMDEIKRIAQQGLES